MMMKQRRPTPEEREQDARPEPVSDCRPGIRGYCSIPDCPKCRPVRERAQQKADEAK